MILASLFAVFVIAACGKVELRVQPKVNTTAPWKDSYDESREVMVHLFEWKYSDVADECERFLSQYGYTAVQVSPPSEHVKLYKNNDIPWWIRYQPISYKICSRGGDESAFKDMVERCSKVGIRVVADVVTNHMAGQGQSGNGWCGTGFNCQDHGESFPGVPYGANDFNDNICDHDINNYQDAWNVRKCRLSGLADINQDNDYPRGKIADYLNSLAALGVGGFRVDAAKHQYPAHLADIINRVNLNSKFHAEGTKPLLALEVIDMNTGEAVHAADYLYIGRVVNFIYGQDVSGAVRRSNNFKYFGNFGQSWNMWPSGNVVVAIDNHDNQRGHGGNSPLTYKDGFSYTMAVTYMLSWPYGLPRVMSSYYFTDADHGPPADSNGMAKSPYFRSDGTCDPNSGWVCEHRWPEIRRMTNFRKVTADQNVYDIVTDDNRIAFRRGNKGFFAVNNNGGATWTATFQTGLRGGTYCDIISGEPTENGCSGTTVGVGGDGKAQISVGQGKTFALYVGAQPGNKGTTHSVPKGSTSQPGIRQKTVVYLKKSTQPGQNVFIRGGSKCESQQCTVQIAVDTEDAPKVCGADYVKWAEGDTKLDWTGAESGQSSGAQGTPMYYTTNTVSSTCYDCENVKLKLGDAYWKVEMIMDCSQTSDGWFEFKGYMNGWESDVSQAASCSGNKGAAAPYKTNNHVALCGATNIFTWGSGDCEINTFETC